MKFGVLFSSIHYIQIDVDKQRDSTKLASSVVLTL